MLRTMKREMALSLGMAFPVETHLCCQGCQGSKEKRKTATSELVERKKPSVCDRKQTNELSRAYANLPHALDVSATLLITSVVSTLDSHIVNPTKYLKQREGEKCTQRTHRRKCW